MKTPKYLTALLFAAAAASASAAEIASGEGKVFDAPDYVVVRKKLAAGSEMKRHNHPGHDVLLTMSKGRVVFELNDGEKHELKPGDVMRFDGADFISGKAAEASEFVVTLNKRENRRRDGKRARSSPPSLNFPVKRKTQAV